VKPRTRVPFSSSAVFAIAVRERRRGEEKRYRFRRGKRGKEKRSGADFSIFFSDRCCPRPIPQKREEEKKEREGKDSVARGEKKRRGGHLDVLPVSVAHPPRCPVAA